MDNEVIVTKHAKKRVKERVGISKKLVEKNAEKALKFGIKHSDTTGRLNRYFSHLYFVNKNANNVRIYNKKVYIFCDERLITVFDLPQKYRRLVDNLKNEIT